MAAAILAVDIGGTKILTAVVGADGAVLARRRVATPDRGVAPVLEAIVHSARTVLEDRGLTFRDVAAAGVGAPGPLDPDAGVVFEPPNMEGWHDVPLAALLHERLGAPVFVENDANAAALGEWWVGAGRGVADLIYLTVSTGIGGGIIIDGRPYHGKSGAAGEMGHVVVLADGPLCGCGTRGCLEALSSGTAIARQARELLARGKAPGLAHLLEDGEAPTARLVAEAAARGDADCLALLAQAGRYLGIALAGYVNIFDPELVVLGGGVVQAGEAFLAPARENMYALALAQPRRGLRLATGELGDEAGALGMIATLSARYGA